jgi:hypothetical protein
MIIPDTTKMTAALVIATLTISASPGLATAGDWPNPDLPNCRGRAISSGLAVARDAGNHGLADTVGGPGLETVQDLQELITGFCDGS